MSASSTYALGSLGDVFSRVEDWFGGFDALDCVLIGFGLAVVVLTWMGIVGRARLGTIDVSTLVSDGASPPVAAATALLQKSLARMGWRPSGGVPSGSPTAANFAAAIEAAPIPQAQWLGSLLGALPIPALSTGFQVTGTLRAAESSSQTEGEDVASGDVDKRELIYNLVALRSKQSVETKGVPGKDDNAAVRAAANAIFRAVVKNAPAIYPPWGQWRTEDALDKYLEGLDAEINAKAKVASRFKIALDAYLAASEIEPENVLVQLRIANCYERLSLNADDEASTATLLEALNTYVAVRLRYPAIFEARYRASVLLGRLATEELSKPNEDALRVAVMRLERDSIRNGDRTRDGDRSRLQTALSKFWQRALGSQVNPAIDGGGTNDAADLTRRATTSALRESKAARRSLRPMWTLLHEGRFRYVYEPTGSERRGLRRALRISRMCLRVREDRTQENAGLSQVWWRTCVFLGCFAGRSRIAGWQAHYNAACFYALLPRASSRGDFLSSARVRTVALKHLRLAISDPDHTLSCTYVRDEDPDLKALRDRSPVEWQNDIVSRICPLELVVHYRRPATTADDYRAWCLRVTGDAISEQGDPKWQNLEPSTTTDHEATYRIPIHRDTAGLELLAKSGDLQPDLPWRLIPAQQPSPEIWITSGDPEVYGTPSGATGV